METKWDLSVLYKSLDDENIEKDIALVQQKLDETESCIASEMGDKEKLEKLVTLMEETVEIGERLGLYAGLTLATDATNEKALQLNDTLQMNEVRQNVVGSAVQRYVGTVEGLEDVIASSECLQQVGYALRVMARDAKHIPDAAIHEWLLKMSLNGATAFSGLRDKLDATLLVDYDGKQIPLSAARAMAYDPSAAVRKAAYEAELASYKKVEIPMAACLNAIKGEAITMSEAEHYDSVLDKTLQESHMDAATLNAMLDAIRESLPSFRKYLRRKGEMLGYKNGIPFHDLFAPLPIPGYEPKQYTIEECREKLVSVLSQFSPAMGDFINEAFENRWIDVYPAEGKSGGAFCAGLHKLDQSRVMTNFAGSYSDVSTIAHELGHGWHNRNLAGLPYMMIDTPMQLAETASIFNETLLARAAMAQAEEKERLALLEANLMETNQCIVDIYSRYLFETAVIEGKKSHNASPEELCRMMLEAQEQSYGDGLDPELRHPYMWACKSHYYSAGLNFYNFPYAFGQLFGTGVYACYAEEGASFVPKYNQLLRSCGSMDIADVAASVGIDVRSVDFWRSALKVYEDEIEEFLRLTAEL